ncbi:MAG: calcium/sodium antiporter [Elusimicrobiales bacterium]|nr:calcium/sodium antiporter [Elusimicrobiales bacterium]
MSDYTALIIGVACAAIGGEFFVRGSVGLAYCVRISPAIVGATIAAFATSSPELSVAINSALAGNPAISLGDALGSNVVNVAFILAVALVISGIQSPRDSIKRDFPAALLIPVITGVLFLDGELSRLDGFLMLGMFFAWLAAAVNEARKQRRAAEKVPCEKRVWPAVLSCAAGLGFLAAAGKLIVTGARGLAVAFGIDEFIIGAVIVAVGTSVPELATVVVSKLRGYDEVGLGTILGSNIFNGVFIIAVAAIIHPIVAPWREVAVTLAFGLGALLLTYPSRGGFIGRGRGVLLLALYGFYLAVIFMRQAA